jgi:ATP-dependent DNA helicase DinG
MASDIFFSDLIEKCPAKNNSFRIRRPDFIPNTLSDPLLALSSGLKKLLIVSKDEEEKIEISALSSRAKIISDEIETILTQSLRDYVYWMETTKNSRYPRYVIHASPVNVGGLIKETVLDKIRPLVLTSATLSTNRSFDYFRKRIGMEEADELILGSPFDFKKNALLCISPDMPDPGNETENYTKEAIKQIIRILEITKGRTFVLFTNFRMLDEVYNSLQDIPGLKILRQGDLPRYKMLEKFKEGEKEGMVLLGTNTFWQGVDVPGRALECVIITKLPFAVPDDPITETKMEYLRKEGKEPFISYQVPQAVIMLKQGFGRLIRTKDDTGVIAILDPRLKTKSYGEIFLKSLPECRITSDVEEIGKFFSEIENRPDSA